MREEDHGEKWRLSDLKEGFCVQGVQGSRRRTNNELVDGSSASIRRCPVINLVRTRSVYNSAIRKLIFYGNLVLVLVSLRLYKLVREQTSFVISLDIRNRSNLDETTSESSATLVELGIRRTPYRSHAPHRVSIDHVEETRLIVELTCSIFPIPPINVFLVPEKGVVMLMP
ncbi:hypothetical protein WN51_10853 [Melipona quadrifasciata]|uniref:Uncharacterized protein n=1 Tax=Melipona quadrifasciata TaxID=166423 RepID=A0A0M9A4T9_9HYME|nr:hypothetical protein WN51_10853 [Melipona quadrifasciata]